MKAKDLINDALSEWREVRHAPDLAQELFDRLDVEEIRRLAVRGFTEEIRSGLRRKDENGVPVYGSTTVLDETGKKRRLYKQTVLFTVADYEICIAGHDREIDAHVRAKQALVADCFRRHGVQLTLEAIAS